MLKNDKSGEADNLQLRKDQINDKMNAQQEQIEVQDEKFRQKELEVKMNENSFKTMQESI